MGKIKDITGQRFGRLMLLERLPKYKNNKTYYRCLCDCGNECFASGSHLAEGSVKSCGCLVSESARKRMINKFTKNKIEKIDNFVKIYLSNSNNYTIIDESCYDNVKNYRWLEINGYACSHTRGTSHEKRKELKLHRLIMNCYNTNDTRLTDHINHNKLDNTLKNLRLVDNYINNQNRLVSSKSSTNHKNVVRRRGKYCVCFVRNDISYYCGSYNLIENAIQARNKKYKELGIPIED